jgi:hypothetical protein
MEVPLEVLLELIFLHSTSKFWSRGPYKGSTGVALTIMLGIFSPSLGKKERACNLASPSHESLPVPTWPVPPPLSKERPSASLRRAPLAAPPPMSSMHRPCLLSSSFAAPLRRSPTAGCPRRRRLPTWTDAALARVHGGAQAQARRRGAR